MKIIKRITQLKQRLVSRYAKFRDDKLLATLLKDVPASDQSLVRLLLTNQLLSLNSSITAEGRTDASDIRKRVMMNASKQMIRKVIGLRGVIAIQPMQGPVGLVYLLQFSAGDESGQEIRLCINTHTTEARTRKLRPTLTLEAMQDLQSFYKLDVEQEVAAVLASACAEGFGQEVVQDLLSLADANVDVVLDNQQPSNNAVRLIVGINQAAARIAMRTRRGVGNYIIASPAAVDVLSTPGAGFVFCRDEDTQGMMSCRKVGVMELGGNKAYTVYESMEPVLSIDGKETIIVGYKGGTGEVDAGYILSPYVPILSGGVSIDPNTYQPQIPLMTRYGKTIVTEPSGDTTYDSRNYYHTVTYNHGDLTPTIE